MKNFADREPGSTSTKVAVISFERKPSLRPQERQPFANVRSRRTTAPGSFTRCLEQAVLSGQVDAIVSPVASSIPARFRRCCSTSLSGPISNPARNGQPAFYASAPSSPAQPKEQLIT